MFACISKESQFRISILNKTFVFSAGSLEYYFNISYNLQNYLIMKLDQVHACSDVFLMKMKHGLSFLPFR